VVLGLGVATFVPDNGVTAISVGDVDGVKIAGLLIDGRHDQLAAAGRGRPERLVGQPRGQPDRAVGRALPPRRRDRRQGHPVAGGQQQQRDHRRHLDLAADHDDNNGTAGWNTNTGANALVVNGNNVTAYGLFASTTSSTR